jgi:hypothetical protein
VISCELDCAFAANPAWVGIAASFRLEAPSSHSGRTRRAVGLSRGLLEARRRCSRIEHSSFSPRCSSPARTKSESSRGRLWGQATPPRSPPRGPSRPRSASYLD